KKVRQLAVGPRIAQRLGWVALGQAFALGEFVKAAQRCEAASDRGLGITRFVQRRDVAAEVEGRNIAGLGRVAVCLREVVGERSEVFAIRFLRQRGRVALDAEEAEESGDGGVHAAPRHKSEGLRTDVKSLRR